MFTRIWSSNVRKISLLSRVWNGPQNIMTTKLDEDRIIRTLRSQFPKAKVIEVFDISGGCGAMFDINVITDEFKGLSTVKQHRIINEALRHEIKGMHGIRINTGIPEE